MAFLGIDIGTSAVKAVVTDEREALAAAAERPLSTDRPRPGWSEQDASSWCDAVGSILDGFAADAPALLERVEGIGLSGQMHGAVCLGADDRPVRPVILWNDGRAVAEAAELNAGYPHLAAVLGVPAMAGFTAPKLLWMRRAEPERADEVRLVLSPKDYVRLWLTGERVTDMSDAAGSWWLDQARRDWSPEALEATGMSEALMPRLVEGSAISGVLRAGLARRWGLRDGIPVAGGAGDAMAGAIGIGAVEDGPFLSIGTSAQLFAPGRSFRPRPEDYIHAFCHAVPDRWAQIAALLNGASCLAWIAAVLDRPIEALLAEAADAPDRPAAATFLPYLTGERTPHNDVEATGAFFGLTPATGRAELVRAVLEGVAYSFADAARCLEAAGTRLSGAAVVGGGARSAMWVQILADVLGIPLTRYRSAEKGPAFGAARLARIAARGEDVLAVATPPPVQDVTMPRADRTEAYAGRVASFRRLYAATSAAR